MKVATIARIAEEAGKPVRGSKLVKSAIKSYRHIVKGCNTGEAHLIDGGFVLVCNPIEGDYVFTIQDFKNSFEGTFLESACESLGI